MCAQFYWMYPPANGRGEELIAPNDSGRHGTLSAGHGDTLDTLDTWTLWTLWTLGRCLVPFPPIFFYGNENLCVCYNYKPKYDV